MFNILLDHPGLGLRVFVEDKLIDVSEIPEEFNSSALIQGCGFDEPHVLSAMLDWHSFFV
jgi:hypothetical protein